PTATPPTTTACWLSCFLCCKFLVSQVSAVNPYFDADTAVCGFGFELTKLNIGAQGVQWHTTFTVELGTAHISTAQSAGYLNTDTFCACAHCRLDGTTHCTAECHTCGELLSNTLGYKLCIEFWFLDF